MMMTSKSPGWRRVKQSVQDQATPKPFSSCVFCSSWSAKPLSRKAIDAILRRVKISVLPKCGRLIPIFLVCLLALAELGSAATKSHRAQESLPRFEALPLTRSQQNHLLVRAYINGKPALLGVDSGAPISAISSRRRAHFGLTGIPGGSQLPARIQINGAFNSVALVRNLRLGSINVMDDPVVVVDLSESNGRPRLVPGQDIDGILGVDILFSFGAVLDCQRQLLMLKTDPESTEAIPGVEYRGLQRMPMRLSDNYNLYVDAAINGTPASLMVDTGAFATLLNRRFVRSLHVPVYRTPFNSSAVNMKQRGVSIARIKRLSVGSVDIVGKDVGVVDLAGLIHSDLSRSSSQPVAGLLGAEILRSHHGIIDFGTRTLYLKN
jgi:predicted aspartyl protease